jgi:hypothetical protein
MVVFVNIELDTSENSDTPSLVNYYNPKSPSVYIHEDNSVNFCSVSQKIEKLQS